MMSLSNTQLNILRAFVYPDYKGRAAKKSCHTIATFNNNMPHLIKKKLIKKHGKSTAENGRETMFYVATEKALELLHTEKCPECRHVVAKDINICWNCGACLNERLSILGENQMEAEK